MRTQRRTIRLRPSPQNNIPTKQRNPPPTRAPTPTPPPPPPIPTPPPHPTPSPHPEPTTHTTQLPDDTNSQVTHTRTERINGAVPCLQPKGRNTAPRQSFTHHPGDIHRRRGSVRYLPPPRRRSRRHGR